MRIEILGANKGFSGLQSATSLGLFAVTLEKLKQKQKLISYGFRGAQCAAVGGTGYSGSSYDKTNLAKSERNVQDACQSLETRIQAVEQKKEEKLETVSKRFASFVKATVAADWNCKYAIDRKNEAWYEKYSWLKPPPPPKKKSWWQKLCDAVSSAVKAVGNFFKKIGNSIKNAVLWVVDKIKKGFQEIGKFIKEHYKAIIKYVVGAVVIAGCFVLSAVTCGAAAPIFAAAATAALTGGLTSLGTTIVTGIAEGKSFGEIFDEGGGAFMTGAVAGAVSGGLGAAGGTLVGTIGNEILAKGAQVIVEVGSNMAGRVVSDGLDYMIEHDGNLGGFFTNNDNYWSGVLADGVSGLANGAVGIVKDQLMDVGKDVVGELVDFVNQTEFGKVVNETISQVTDAYGEVKDWINDTIGDAKDWLNNTVGDAYDWLKDTYEQGKQWVEDQVGDAKGWLQNEIGGAKNWVKDQLQFAQDWAQDTFGIDRLSDVMDIVKNPSEFAQHIGGDIMENMFGTRSPEELLNNGLNQIAESLGLSEMADIFSNLNINDIVSSIQLPDLTKLPGISDIVSGAQNAVNDAISGVTGAVNDIASTVNGIAAGAQNAVNNAISGITGAANSAVNTVNNIAAGAQNAVNNAINSVNNAVNNAVSGVSSAVNSAKDTVVNTATNAVNSVIGGSFPSSVTSAVKPVVDFGQHAANILGSLW